MKVALNALVGGLLLGGIIHIAVVLLVPLYADNDAWARVQTFDAGMRFRTLPRSTPAGEAMPSLDPLMAHAVCSFNLANGAVRITATLPDTFWSAAVFDRRGRNVFSLNDASTQDERLDLVLTTPVQMAQIRQNPPETLETAIIFERALEEGFVLLRVLVPDESWDAIVNGALDAVRCESGV